MPPLTIRSDLSPYAVGKRVNSEEWNGFTRTCETATLGFGYPVKEGTGKHSCRELAANGDKFIGITEATAVLPRPGDGYVQYDNVPVCEWGVIAVQVTGNVTKGAQARWDLSNHIWTAAAQSATVATVPGATFEETATAPGVTPIRLRRMGPSAITAS